MWWFIIAGVLVIVTIIAFHVLGICRSNSHDVQPFEVLAEDLPNDNKTLSKADTLL